MASQPVAPVAPIAPMELEPVAPEPMEPDPTKPETAAAELDGEQSNVSELESLDELPPAPVAGARPEDPAS